MIDLHTKDPDGHSRSTRPRPTFIVTKDGDTFHLIMDGFNRGKYRLVHGRGRPGTIYDWAFVFGKLAPLFQSLYLSNSPIPDEPAPN